MKSQLYLHIKYAAQDGTISFSVLPFYNLPNGD
jgi:hypothetical protein